MEERKTTWGEKIGYGVGAIGLDLSYGLFYSFLSYYLSSVLGLKEGFLLLLTPLARIWDGINDPMMGTIVDNTRFKNGKYRPWILIGAVSNAVVLFLLFTKFGLSGTPLYIYIGIMYILWGMTNTMADIPYWSMVPSFTSDPKDRNMVSTVARTFWDKVLLRLLLRLFCRFYQQVLRPTKVTARQVFLVGQEYLL